MKVSIAICLFAAVCVFARVKTNIKEDPDFPKFAEFMGKYEKHYASQNEFEYRFGVFKQSLAKIEELNADETNHATHGVTQFADMTAEEFQNFPCGGVLSRLPAKTDVDVVLGDASELGNTTPPAAWDWTTRGAVTPIKNQGQCGSCWAFSTVGNMEGVWFLAGNTLTSLAEGELVDCSTTDYGCDGGWPFWALTDVLASPYNGRMDTESSYPYVAQDETCTFTTGGVGATFSSYKSYCTEQTTPCTETLMMNLLVNSGPLSACLDATPMQYYTSGIDYPKTCDPSAIDHCITIVGYGVDSATGDKFWKIKNSWGTSWGESGYYYLIKGVANHPAGICGINKVITMASV